MATDKYDLHTIDYSVQGWDAIMATDMEILDDEINTRILATLGETVAISDALYIHTDGKYYKAQADGTKQPAMGLALETGILDDSIRIQRVGPITDTGWSWSDVGKTIFLSTTVAGDLTETEPATNSQTVGVVLSTTSIFLDVELATTVSGGGGGTSNHSELNELDYASAGHTGFSPDTHTHTLLDLSDTPVAYDNNKYLKSTTSGVEWATVSGNGSSDHSELSNLAYADSGHTGFSPTSHSHTESDISDLDKYTAAEVDTISGALNTSISAKPDTLLELTDTPAAYDDGKYLKSTAGAIEFVTPEGIALIAEVKEENTSTITKGQMCAITGSSGAKFEVGLCDCDDATKIRIVGLAQTNIAQNGEGVVVYKGELLNVDSRTTNTDVNPNAETWNAGDLLYVSRTPGGLTKTRPTSGRCIKAGRTQKGNSASDTFLAIVDTNSICACAASGEDLCHRMGDSAGINKISYKNYANDEVGAIDSLGNLTISGTLQLGDTLEINEETLLIDATLTSDHTWTGPTQTITAGENLAIFDTAYLKSDGKYWKTDMKEEAKSDSKLVMSTASINSDATGIALLPGEFSYIRDDSTEKWTVSAAGDIMFLSTSGTLTNNISGYVTGDIIRLSGYMETATIFNFQADKTFIEK